jgi:preprotein translocase subunit YajC
MGFLYGLASYGLPVLAATKSIATSTATKPSAFQQYGLFILIAVMLVVFYLFLIRPQRKRATEHEDMLGSIKKGDEVVTIGGIHGTVKKITADTMEIEVDKNVRLTFSKTAVSKKVTEDEEEEEETEEPEDSSGDGDDNEE